MSRLPFHITTRINYRTVQFQQPIADPFVRQVVHVGWKDLLRGLLHRELCITVIVGADPSLMDRVIRATEVAVREYKLAERRRI